MPVYTYAVENPDGSLGETFEVEQPATDKPLKRHPITGAPVRRVFSAPNIALKHTASIEKKILEPKRTAAYGFTRYERGSKGVYHKVSGEGPETLKP